MSKYTINPIFDVTAEHGEGSIYDQKTDTVYWVDLLKGYVLSGKLSAGGEITKWKYPEPVGCIAQKQNDELILGMQTGFASAQGETVTDVYKTESHYPQKDVRFNDGIAGPDGAFYAGTMKMDGSENVGQLFKLSSEGNVEVLDENLRIPNGMGWSNDEQTFYMIDTEEHVMYAYDFDRSKGSLSNRKVHIQFPDNDFPDGMTMDADENFWIAMWGGGRIDKYDKSGSKLEEVKLPVPYPTSCCFVGEKLDQLFVTTSQLIVSDYDLKKYPNSGRCFLIEVNQKGKTDFKFS